MPQQNGQVPGYRPLRTTVRTGAIIAVALLAGSVAFVIGRHGSTTAPRQMVQQMMPVRLLPATPASYLGVFEPGEMASYEAVTKFGTAVGRRPDIVLYFSGWGNPFQGDFADTARSHGATVLVQMEPFTVSVASIAAGASDRYLRSYADAVRAFRSPVILSFAPEMNGRWYSWGYRHASPATWVAAWRHIVEVFRFRGARNVIWLWTVNRTGSGGTNPVREWWPGGSYVTWVGIDGYYFTRSATFGIVFRQAIREVRAVTRDPILLSETAVGAVAGASKIPGLFAGIKRDHLLGFVWFDHAEHGGVYHQNWRLNDHPAILAAFRRAVRRYISPWQPFSSPGAAQRHRHHVTRRRTRRHQPTRELRPAGSAPAGRST